jgi:hypothetical protein
LLNFRNLFVTFAHVTASAMKKLLYFLLLGGLGLSCTAPRTLVDANRDHLFTHSFNQTYTILESADFTALSADQQAVIRQEIDRQMQARGVPANRPTAGPVHCFFAVRLEFSAQRLAESR